MTPATTADARSGCTWTVPLAPIRSSNPSSPGGLVLTAAARDAVGEAVARYGTPLYLYDEPTLLATLARIRSAIDYPATDLLYALVANRAWRITSSAAREGWRFHFNSPLEIDVARHALRRDGGFRPVEIDGIIAESVFSGGSISREQMRAILANRVFLHVTARDQVALYGELHPPSEPGVIGLRLQFDANMQRARQGITPKEIPDTLALARRYGLSITSVHMYRGTGTHSPEVFAAPFNEFAELAMRFPDLEHVDIGGGFGYDYQSRGTVFDWNALSPQITQLMERLNASFGRELRLRLEVGRAAVASCGVFVVRVLSRKPGFRPNEVILGVDASSMSLRAAAPAVAGKRYHFTVPGGRTGEDGGQLYTLVGPTTYTSDYLAKRVRISGARSGGVQPGDLVVVLDCGAYGAVTHSEFLTTHRPAEAIVTASGELLPLARRTGVEQITANWS